jgi:3',5'-cyclic-AMP phosphodiesterase
MGPVLIAQLTDTHVVAGDTTTRVFVDNNERLRHAVASICAESPRVDAVLVTGDMVEDGRRGEYGELAALLDPIEAPILAIPGNHDNREFVRATFNEIDWSTEEHLSWVTVIGGVRVVGLDSVREGQAGAEFDEVRAAWLSSVLGDAHDGPTLLAMHHPPFTTGIEWMDRSGFVGLDLLRDVLTGSAVGRIVCGHLHRPMTSMFAGIPAQVGISTVQHVALDLSPSSQLSLVHDPVGYQIHRVAGHDIVTHVRYFDTGATPFVPTPVRGA